MKHYLFTVGQPVVCIAEKWVSAYTNAPPAARHALPLLNKVYHVGSMDSEDGINYITLREMPSTHFGGCFRYAEYKFAPVNAALDKAIAELVEPKEMVVCW
jgi:hypothetical protein